MQLFNSPQNNVLTTSLTNNSSSASVSVYQTAGASSLNDPLYQTNRSSSNPFDFNGDGKTDLFWYNNQTGDTRSWLMSGTNSPTVASYNKVTSSAGWTLEGFGDFNGDSKTDVFWYNLYTGDTRVWYMDGSKSPTVSSFEKVPAQPGWQFKGFGDFNGDGKTDLFWYNKQTGDTKAWLMNGSTSPTIASYNKVSPLSGWSLEGFGDFNGDGKSDLLWYNRQTGDAKAWLMNGNNSPTPTTLGTVSPNSGWTFQGLGDFNGDRKTDLLLRNTQTGDTQAWLTNGTKTSAIVHYSKMSAQDGWCFEGLGDFNGDGRSDALWYNKQTGVTETWLMNETGSPSRRTSRQDMSSYWDLQALGDFNGDGKTEMFWRNYGVSNAGVQIWSMNGQNNYYASGYGNYHASSYGKELTESGWQLVGINQLMGTAVS